MDTVITVHPAHRRCIICLEEEPQPILKKLSCRCNIIIHESCLESWYNHNNSHQCPICRVPLLYEAIHHNPIFGSILVPQSRNIYSLFNNIVKCIELLILFMCCSFLIFVPLYILYLILVNR